MTLFVIYLHVFLLMVDFDVVRLTFDMIESYEFSDSPFGSLLNRVVPTKTEFGVIAEAVAPTMNISSELSRSKVDARVNMTTPHPFGELAHDISETSINLFLKGLDEVVKDLAKAQIEGIFKKMIEDQIKEAVILRRQAQESLSKVGFSFS